MPKWKKLSTKTFLTCSGGAASVSFPAMAPSATSQNQPPARAAARKTPARQSPALTLFTVLIFGVAVAAAAMNGLAGKPGWPDALLLIFAGVSSMAALARQLPLQNILTATAAIALMGGAAHVLNAWLKIPFGPQLFRADAGPKIINDLSWAMPVLWATAVLSSRGVARLVLRPWRKMKTYGYWLMGVTAVLVVLWEFALEPYASHVKHYWLWTPTKFPLAWFGAPLVNFLAWLFVTLLMLAFVTPTLIKKQPGTRGGADYHPLAVWLGAVVLFAVATALNRLWAATAAEAAIGLVTAVFAIRGGRW